MKTKMIFGGMLACALISALFGIFSFQKDIAKAAPQPATKVQPMKPTPAQFQCFHWQDGNHSAWKLNVSLKLSGSDDASEMMGFTAISGTMELTTLSVAGQQVTLAGAMTESTVVCNGTREPRFESLFNSTPVIITMSAEGRIVSLRFPANVAAEDRSMLRLVYGWEMVARNLSEYREIEGANLTEAIPFFANYRRQGPAGIEKERFVDPRALGQENAAQKVTHSSFLGAVGQLWLGSLEGSESSELYLNGQIFAASQITVSLHEMNRAIGLSPLLMELVSRPQGVSGFTEVPSQSANGSESVTDAVRQDRRIARWGKILFGEIEQALATAAEGEMRDAIKPLEDFKEWLRAHGMGGTVQALAALSSSTNAGASGLIVHALAAVDTESSRGAISSILMNAAAFPKAVHLQAIDAAGDLGASASIALKDQLAQLLDAPADPEASFQVADTALFALARLAVSDPEAGQFLMERLAPSLEAGAPSDTAAKALFALANGRLTNDRLKERANQYMESADSDLRRAATEYLAAFSESAEASEAPALSNDK